MVVSLVSFRKPPPDIIYLIIKKLFSISKCSILTSLNYASSLILNYSFITLIFNVLPLTDHQWNSYIQKNPRLMQLINKKIL